VTGPEGPQFLAHRRTDVHDTGITAPFGWISHKTRSTVRDFVAAAQLRPGARVVDFGCGTQPYRNELPPDVDYIGADIRGNPLASVEIGSDGRLAIGDGSTDVVVSVYVLEHVEEPKVYLSEATRVLRPGGTLLLFVPFLMYYHRDPEDYWRWTRAGAAKIVADAGLAVAEMRGLLGLAPAALQNFQDETLFGPPRVRRVYIALMQTLIRLADRFYTEDSRLESSLALAIRATKPL
jgi:SAM-dependent methyltransferase